MDYLDNIKQFINLVELMLNLDGEIFQCLLQRLSLPHAARRVMGIVLGLEFRTLVLQVAEMIFLPSDHIRECADGLQSWANGRIRIPDALGNWN